MVLAIEAEELKIGYEDDTTIWAVKGVSFRVEEGEIFCLVGESGCGKSTTGNAIVGILPPYAVTDGVLRIFGKTVIQGNKRDYTGIRGRIVSYVPQNPGSSLNPYLTIEEQFYYVLNSIYGWDKKKAIEEASRYLKLVELDPERVMDQFPHELSGGMQQRTAIALALSTGAKIIVADEPTSALDAHLRLGLIRLLTRLRDSAGLTLVFITHDLLSAGKICDKIAIMYSGRILEMGASGQILTEPLHPYTELLVDSVPVLGLLKPLKAIPGEPPSPIVEVKGCIFLDRCPKKFEKCSTSHPPSAFIHERIVECWRYLEK
ncbi:MAG: ABC transporter ATP-binding protein [Thermosphaera sp.]